MSDKFYGFGDKDFDTTAIEWLRENYDGFRYRKRPDGEWVYQLSEPVIIEMLDAYAEHLAEAKTGPAEK